MPPRIVDDIFVKAHCVEPGHGVHLNATPSQQCNALYGRHDPNVKNRAAKAHCVEIRCHLSKQIQADARRAAHQGGGCAVGSGAARPSRLTVLSRGCTREVRW